jgi:hypothetical protein
MSATADALTLAMERAFPKLDLAGMEDLMDRFFNNLATPAEAAAIQAEFEKVTRADIGREPLE